MSNTNTQPYKRNISQRKHFTKIERRKVWNYNVGINKGTANCPLCNITIMDMLNFEIGHKIALSKGGSNNLDNLIPLCSSCNRSQGTKPFDEVNNLINGIQNITLDTKDHKNISKNEGNYDSENEFIINKMKKFMISHVNNDYDSENELIIKRKVL